MEITALIKSRLRGRMHKVEDWRNLYLGPLSNSDTSATNRPYLASLILAPCMAARGHQQSRSVWPSRKKNH